MGFKWLNKEHLKKVVAKAREMAIQKGLRARSGPIVEVGASKNLTDKQRKRLKETWVERDKEAKEYTKRKVEEQAEIQREKNEEPLRWKYEKRKKER